MGNVGYFCAVGLFSVRIGYGADSFFLPLLIAECLVTWQTQHYLPGVNWHQSAQQDELVRAKLQAAGVDAYCYPRQQVQC